jgi:hypothetical protein
LVIPEDCTSLPFAFQDGVAEEQAAPMCLYPETSFFAPHDGSGFPDPEHFDRSLYSASGLTINDLANPPNPMAFLPSLKQYTALRSASAFPSDSYSWSDRMLIELVWSSHPDVDLIFEVGTGSGAGSLRLSQLARMRGSAFTSIDLVDRRSEDARRAWTDDAGMKFKLAKEALIGGEAAEISQARQVANTFQQALAEELKEFSNAQPKSLTVIGCGCGAGFDSTSGSGYVDVLGGFTQTETPSTQTWPPSTSVRPPSQKEGGAHAAACLAETVAAVMDSDFDAGALLLVCAASAAAMAAVAQRSVGGEAGPSSNQRWKKIRRLDDIRETLQSPLVLLQLQEGHAQSALPVLAVVPQFKLYWGWPEKALSQMPAQCAHRCQLTTNTSAAQYLIYPAHFVGPDNEEALDWTPPGKQALLVCMEPWCDMWKNVSDPRVKAVIGYHRLFDFWLPNRCPEMLDLMRNGPPAPSLATKTNSSSSIVAAFISNCNTPIRNSILQALMQTTPVDSYGACFKNKDFAEHVEHGHFGAKTYLQKHRAAQQYPFVVAMENIELFDYVTEKVYDAYFAGAVPIYLGAPNIAQYLPGAHSALKIRDFAEPVSDSEEILRLDKLAARMEEIVGNRTEWSRTHTYEWGKNSPVIKRCLELEQLGSIFPSSAAHLRETRQYDRMAYAVCAACEAARQ